MRHGLPMILVFASVAAAAPLGPAWKNWQYSRRIEMPGAEQARLVGVVVPPEVYARAGANLEDIRVIDEQGREVPYVLHTRPGGTSIATRTARMLEPSFLAGQYTQVIVDAGRAPQVHNAVALGIEHADFLTWVEVAVSNEARDWRILRARAPIYSLLKEGMGARTTVTYPDSNSRFLRIRILDGSSRYHFRDVTLRYEVVTEAERGPALLTLVPEAEAPAQHSVWLADAGAARYPLCEVGFETTQAEFYRPVKVETSEDGRDWVRVGSGEIYRMKEGDSLRESLRVAFPEAWGRYWRVRVFNGNDAPLTGIRPALYLTPRHVVFRQEPERSYRLLYGNSRSKAPEYEMGRLTDAKSLESAMAISLATEEVNPDYADPRPWSERHPVVLWAALGAAVVVLALLALRSLRHPA